MGIEYMQRIPPGDDNEDKKVEDKDTLCGMGRFKPGWLQRFANVQTFTACFSGASMLTQTLTFYINSQVPNIEKQFGMSSTDSGALMSFNDIGFLLCSLFVSSLARYVHIPRFLFYCTLLYGISGIVCSLPYFFDTYTSEDYLGLTTSGINNSTNTSNVVANIPICYANSSREQNSKCDLPDEADKVFRVVNPGFRTMAFVVIALGMMVQGLGKAPRTPFVTVYIDDNVEKRKTGFYIGIMMTFAVLGPALAYGLGGYFSKIFVTLENVNISPKDPRFIGAWWLGFLVFGISSLVVAGPLALFPRRLKWSPKKNKEFKNEKISERALITTKDKVKDRVLSYWRVMKNPIYLSILVTNCCQVLGHNGYMSFMSKYIQTQFGTTLWVANIILGSTNITALAIGAFVGGILTRKVKMIPRNTFGLLLTMFIIQNITFIFGFFLGCDQPKVVGPASVHGSAALPLSNCSISCSCSSDDFFPICGSDGLTYHSPCYAGCSKILGEGGSYTNCTCVDGGAASAGSCSSDCIMLYIWIPVAFICGAASTTKIMLSFIAKIRCVADKDKSTAMGFQSFLMSLIAYMPAPILFGKIVDTTCLIWQSGCSKGGACLYYNIVDFRLKIHTFCLILFLGATSSTLFALLRTRKWTSWTPNK